ncbi:MAG TPA: hypothetical protein VM716_14225 [Gemmatimonadales bacterium]|nr:hypothetical protein [Gemmatimonadales bacterium]
METAAAAAAAASPLSAWESFYVIVGSSAAALTGLQFVVVALGAEARTMRGPEVGAFGTPTIVHLCEVLLLSAILSAPWRTIASPALALGLVAAGGLAYTVIVTWRASRSMVYAPVLEDWLWHVTFPFIAYAGLFAAAFLVADDTGTCLFAIAAAALFLLFIGIHNAWDAATYIVSLPGREKEQ